MSDEKSHDETDNWVCIVFMQGEEATEVTHTLLRYDGVVTYRGATEKSVRKALEYLKEWDYGEESEHDLTENPTWGSSDATEELDGYVIAYNTRFGYVSLNRKVRAK